MRRIVCLLLLLYICVLRTNAQTISNAGTEFWIAFPSHAPDFDQQFNPLLANINVFLTGLQASSGTITAGNFSQKFQTTPGQVTEVLIPRAECYIDETDAGKVLPGKAIHITVDDGSPSIVVYAHIYAGQRSEASLILPKEALGQQYYSINYQEHEREGKNYITLVASEPDTRIHIKRGNTELVPGGITLTNVNDVYEYLSDDDLTGVSVAVDPVTSGCKHFALFTGSTGVYIPTKNCTPHSIDPLFQQCYPIESWGTEFGFIPFSTQSPAFPSPVRTAGQFVRILAKDNGTLVKIDDNIVATLNTGQYFTTETPLTKPSFINTSKPVCVAQYAITQSCSSSADVLSSSGYSDPDMVILNPIQFNIKDITLYSSTKQDIKEQYVNILIKTAAIPSLLVNGKPPAGTFQPFASLPDFSYIQLLLKDLTNTFHITANDGFSAIAYGFGNVESYSYSAGTNLASSEAISGIRTATGAKTDSACLADDYHFTLILPYKSSQISWKMDDNEDATVQLDPTGTEINENGRKSYAYSFPKTAAYQITGKHHIKIIAVFSKTIGGCINSSQEIDYEFKVIPPPVAAFHFTKATCDRSVSFFDDSKDDVNGIVAYNWDFGDHNVPSTDNTSILKNPVHAYLQSGDYVVSLTVTSAAGCQTTQTATITINQPAVDFNADKLACVENPANFEDISQTDSFIVAKRIWLFGDNSGKLITADKITTHSYATSGRYTVKLVLLSYSGCTSDTVSKTIDIYDKPVPDFISPAICQSDGIAHFINRSVLPDGTLTFKYFWRFNDNHSTPENPDVSEEKDATHQFIAAGIYNISLTVISSAGCETTINRSFVVNGTMPKSAFDVPAARFCSGEPVAFTDNSAMLDYGSITRLEWYFDVLNHPDEKLVIDSPRAGAIYMHQYERFKQQPDGVNYVVKLIAYSGTGCADSSFKTITALPMPSLKFDQVKTVCVNTAPFQIVEAAEMGGIGGGGTYSGKGVSADGLFNPAIAGSGIHQIKYTFTSIAGCADSISQMVQILSLPAVSAGADRVILAGDSVTLQPTLMDNSLTYKWSPATGLSRDDVPNPVAKPNATQTYKLTVSGGNCSEATTLTVVVLQPISVYNTFTPNGDGINDVWNIPQLNNYPGAVVDIFNRYGTRIYHSIGYAKPWDGRYDGEDVPVGTYYYLITPKNGARVLSGYVVVIR